jgi:hypothetical protein
MTPKFRPVSVSVISILGVFLPGLIWAALLLLALDRLNLLREAGAYIASFGLRPETQTWTFTGGYITISIVIGASVRPHAMRLAESLARPLALTQARRSRRPQSDFMFPYRYDNERTPVYPIICKRAEEILGCPLSPLSRYEPFNTCKRILRVISPTLWEELEYAEAESRMAAGLFLASIAAVVLSMLPPTRWALITVPLACLLGRGFRRYRELDAKCGYLNFAVGTSDAIGRYLSVYRNDAD